MSVEEGGKILGSVKWFSNQKGYGFITPKPGSSVTEDIFVHQSSLHCEGYRTLGEGWDVEFETGLDENGKIKAENVTAVGGGPCTGPHMNRRNRRGRRPRNAEDGEGEAYDEAGAEETPRPPPELPWHDSLSDDAKASLSEKNIRTNTGTIDISLGSARIKLGTRGYASMCHADGIVVEGSFSSDIDGMITFEWKRALEFDPTDAVWKPVLDMDNHPEILSSVYLTDDEVGTVGEEENMGSLMGDSPTDPRSALEENGFEMRRVVLVARPKRRRRHVPR
jgi:cold shock CspA family protein